MKIVTDEERADSVVAQGSGVSAIGSNREWFEMMKRRTPPPPCHEDCFLHRFGPIDSTMLHVTGLITLDQATKCPLSLTPADTQPAPAAATIPVESDKPSIAKAPPVRVYGGGKAVNDALDTALLQYRPMCPDGCFAHRFPSNTMDFLRVIGAISDEEMVPCAEGRSVFHRCMEKSEWEKKYTVERMSDDADNVHPDGITPTRVVTPAFMGNGLVHPGKVCPIPPRKRVDAEFKGMAQPKEHEGKYKGMPIFWDSKASIPKDGPIPENFILGPIFLLAQLWRKCITFFSTATKRGKARKSRALSVDIIANVLAIVAALCVFAFGMHVFVLCQPVAQPMWVIDTCTPLGPGDAGEVVRLDGNGCAYWSYVEALSARQANPWSKDFHAYPHEVTQGLRSEEQNIRQPFNNKGVKAKEMQEIRLDLLGDNGITTPPPIDKNIDGTIVMCGSDRTGCAKCTKHHVNLPDNRITPPIDGKIILCETPDHHGNQKCTEVTHLDDIARHYTTKEEQEEEEHTLKTYIRNIFGRAVV